MSVRPPNSESSLASESSEDFVLKVVTEHHAYLRQVAGFHMTWLGFHFAANAGLLAYLTDQSKQPDPALFTLFGVLAAVWNLLGAAGCWFVTRYYQRAADRLRAADRQLPQVDGVRVSEAMPVELWVRIATLIAGVCVLLAVGWIFALFIGAGSSPRVEDSVSVHSSKHWSTAEA